MPVSMFTTKIESSHSWATSAVSPSATRIDTIARTIGRSPATTAPKTSRRTISAAGRPKRNSPSSRSLLRDLVEVAVGRELAGHRHREPVAAVGLLHGLDQILDRHLRVRAQLHRDERRLVVLGEEPLRLVGRDDLLDGAGRLEPIDEALHLGAERLVVRGRAVAADDHELGRLVADRQGLLLEPLRAHRLGVVRHRALARQVVAEQGGDEAERDHDGRDPRADRPPRMRRGCTGEPFGHGDVVTDVPGLPHGGGW